LVGILLGRGVVNNLLVSQVTLVANQQLIDVLAGVAINFLQPLFDIVEGLLVGDVVDDNDTVGAPVVRRGDGPESLLPGCIPDLQLYRLPVKLYSSDFKVDTYCGNVGLSVCVVGKSQKQARLSHSRVSDEKKLEKVVIFGIHGRHDAGVSALYFF